MSAKTFNYLLFGLHVQSELELPELVTARSLGDCDIEIALGHIAEGPRDAGLHVVDDGLLFVAPDAARYKIVGGQRMIVEPNPGVPERNVRLYLLGSAFGALLHQRGMLPLHANAIEIDGKAVAFMGESGAGKSTIAAWFHDQGYRILADDVCVLSACDSGRPSVAPGLPRLRLWREAMGRTGRDASLYPRSFEGDPKYDKFDVAVQEKGFGREPLILDRVYLLDRADEFRIERIAGLGVAEALFAHTYRGGFVSAASGAQLHWEQVMALAQSVPIYRVERRWGLDRLSTEAEQIIQHVRSNEVPLGTHRATNG